MIEIILLILACAGVLKPSCLTALSVYFGILAAIATLVGIVMIFNGELGAGFIAFICTGILALIIHLLNVKKQQMLDEEDAERNRLARRP